MILFGDGCGDAVLILRWCMAAIYLAIFLKNLKFYYQTTQIVSSRSTEVVETTNIGNAT